MRVQCSNCGAIKGFTYTTSNINKTIYEGWGSYGSALYCPKCTKTWHERNNKDLACNDNTIAVIESIHERNRKMKECEYCMGDVDNRKSLLIDDFNDEIYISGNNTLVGDDDLELSEIKINYCPMCGRKLED